MEKQKIKIQIEKGKRTVWGSCKVNNNLIAAVGASEELMKARMRLAIFKFEGAMAITFEFEEEYI